MAVVRATRAPHHSQAREPFLETRVLRTQFDRVPTIKLRGLAQLCVTLVRSVRSEAPNPIQPQPALGHHVVDAWDGRS